MPPRATRASTSYRPSTMRPMSGSLVVVDTRGSYAPGRAVRGRRSAVSRWAVMEARTRRLAEVAHAVVNAGHIVAGVGEHAVAQHAGESLVVAGHGGVEVGRAASQLPPDG